MPLSNTHLRKSSCFVDSKESTMKSKIQFLLSMIIFGTIGIFVRYIDLSSSEIALLRGLIGSLFSSHVHDEE